MEFCILGLLIMAPQSAYELRRSFERSLSLIYSSSLGSMQVAIKRLLTKCYIELMSDKQTGRPKKTWMVTEEGRRWFFDSLLSPIPHGQLEETILARFHFLGLVGDGAKRRTILTFFITNIEEAIAFMEAQAIHHGNIEIPENYRSIAHYQFATLDYGISAHKHGLAWFRQQLSLEEARSPS